MITYILVTTLFQVDRSLGYAPSFNSAPKSNREFADDFILLSDRLDKMKQLIVTIDEFPAWARLVFLLSGGKVVSNQRWRTKLGKHRSDEKLTQEA